jgi:hypothetical protein
MYYILTRCFSSVGLKEFIVSYFLLEQENFHSFISFQQVANVMDNVQYQIYYQEDGELNEGTDDSQGNLVEQLLNMTN